MNIHLESLSGDAREPVIDIFNYYIEHSFAAYPETKVPSGAFDNLLKMCEGYPAVAARNESGLVVGFGMLRPHSPFPAFSSTAEISCFIKREYTNKGIGTLILDRLILGAREKGLCSILASISSLNEPSISFHKKSGFVECGRFVKIGRKKGRTFDVVWMQRILEQENDKNN
jgi:phosphinothricin acetyltransferase